jgi:glyoxylase-like metal-dependent hydrolase (beta-lactamase superfamily II)
MKYIWSKFASAAAVLAATVAAHPALAQKNADLIKQAVAAQGGADAVHALKTLAAKGDAKFWEPGQSLAAGGEPRYLGAGTFSITWDLGKGAASTAWHRDQVYPEPPVTLDYTEVLQPGIGFVTDSKGSQPMSGIRETAQLRELERASPWLLVKAMGDAANVHALAAQRLGKRSLPAVSYNDGGTTFVILFDPKSHLPAAIRTRDDDNINGDSDYDLVLGDWQAVTGVQVAQSLSYQINGIEVAKLNYREVTANPTVAADAFAVPDAVKAKAKPLATTNVPIQWVLRRLFLTRFLDSDNVIFPEGGGLKLVELAPNVQHVEGGTANNLIINMKDYLVVFDAPYGEAQSRWTIDAAKAKYPGKPIKYLILTHHHMDHTGGMRAYVAEGATIVVPAPDKAYFEKDVRAPRTIVPDALQMHPRSATIQEVKDQFVLKDDTEEVRAYILANPHVHGMVFGYLPKDNIAYVTDLVSPRGPIARSDQTVAFGEALKKHGITGALIAGGHGATAKQSDIEPALAAK